MKIADIRRDIVMIQEAIEQERLVLFVGAGVSANSDVPIWKELTDAMKKPFSSDSVKFADDLKVAQLYLDSYGRKDFLDLVRNTLRIDNVHPNEIHKLLLALHPSHIITTNYDTLIEDAVSNQFQKYAIIRTDKDIPYAKGSNTIVKMHGDFVHGNIVLAEEDYLNYSMNFPLIRAYVQTLFAKNLVLFVGFSFNDINLKFILQSVLNILQDDMQRAYFLTSESVSYSETLYYAKRGLHVLSMPKSVVDEFNYSTKCGGCEIKSSKGQLLFRQLEIIKAYKDDKGIIREVIDFLKSIKDEMCPHIEGLKYILEGYITCWNPYSEGLQIQSKEIEVLKLEKKENKYAFYKKLLMTYGTDIKLIGNFANSNALPQVDSLLLYTRRKRSQTLIDNFYDLDFQAISENLKDIEMSETGMLSDLCKPYLYCLIGDYNSYYSIYKTLAANFYSKRKYILYFFCMYNLVSMYGRLMVQRFYKNFHFDEKVKEEVKSIDLHRILNKLPISSVVRHILEDLLYNKLQLKILTKVLDLKNELANQRISSEKGGASLNSNIELLDIHVERFLLFCHNNFLICHKDEISMQIFKEYIEGILESYATVSRSMKIIPMLNTKLECFGEQHVKIMIFHVTTKELSLCFRRARVNNIKLDEMALTYLEKLISNSIESLTKEYLQPTKVQVDIWNILENILFIYCRLDVNQQKGDIYYLVYYFWKNGFELNELPISDLIYQNKPTFKEACELIIVYLQHRVQRHYNNAVIHALSTVIKDYHQIVNEIYSFEQFSINQMSLINLAALYNVVRNSVQKEIIDFILQNVDSLPLLFHLYEYGVPVITKESLSRFLPTDFGEVPDYKPYKTWVCCDLAKIRKDNSLCELHSLIDKNFSNDLCFRFFMDPYSVINEEIDLMWVVTNEEDSVIKAYVENPYQRKRLLEFILREKEGKIYQDKVLNFFLIYDS